MFRFSRSLPPLGRLVLIAALVAIIGACAAAYENSLHASFIYDDTDSIVNNPDIRSLWPPWRAFTPTRADTTVAGRPVLWLSLAGNYSVGGLNPWGYHLTNGLFHIVTAILLFGCVRRTLGFSVAWRTVFGSRLAPQTDQAEWDRLNALIGNLPHKGPVPTIRVPAASYRGAPAAAGGKSALRPGGEGEDLVDVTLFALSVALIWALHPLQTEAVTYVVQRAESLAGLFYMATIYAFIRMAQAETGDGVPGERRYAGGTFEQMTERAKASGARRLGGWGILCILFCLLGMATKEIVATAPLLVLLYDRAIVSGSFRLALRRHWRLHASLALCWIPLLLLVASTGWNRSGSVGFGVGVPPWAYWLTQVEAICRYLGLAFWPKDIVFNFGAFWLRRPEDVLPFAAVVAPLLAATAFTLWRKPVIGFVMAWFFVILAPTSLMPGTTEMVVEHRMYLPLAALAAAVAYAFWRVAGRHGILLLCAASAGLGCLTHRRNADYASERSIWADTVAKRPDNGGAHFGLANAYLGEGRIQEALVEFQRSIELDPDNSVTRRNLAILYVSLGRYADAVGQFEASFKIKLGDGWALANYAKALMMTGRNEAAIRQFAAAVHLIPDDAGLRANYGLALEKSGQIQEALEQLDTAVAYAPEDPACRLALGRCLMKADRWPEAILQLQRAARNRDMEPKALTVLGVGSLRHGQVEDAIRYLREALRIGPPNSEADANLAVAYSRVDRYAEAEAPVRAWIAADPSSMAAHGYLGTLLVRLGRPREAVEEFQTVIKSEPGNVRAHEDLADVRFALGEYPVALGEYEAALEIDPHDRRAVEGQRRAIEAGGLEKDGAQPAPPASAPPPGAAQGQ